MKKLLYGLAVVVVFGILLAGCGGGGGSGGSDGGGSGGGSSDTANLNKFSSDDWNSLSEEEKLELANKANLRLFLTVQPIKVGPTWRARLFQ